MSVRSPTVLGWDLPHAARAAAAALVAFALVVVATALTDEGGVAWGTRLGRAYPVIPLCAALGTFAAHARRRSREGRRGLAALGRSPQRNAAGAVAGGALVAMLAAVPLVASAHLDVDGFFPSVVRATEIRYDAADGGRFVVPRRGIAVDRAGDLALAEASPGAEDVAGIPPRGRAAAATVTCLTGVALALLVVTLGGPGRGRTLLAVGFSLLATVLLFHAAAAHRVSALAAVVPAALLVAYACARYRRWGWVLLR